MWPWAAILWTVYAAVRYLHEMEISQNVQVPPDASVKHLSVQSSKRRFQVLTWRFCRSASLCCFKRSCCWACCTRSLTLAACLCSLAASFSYGPQNHTGRFPNVHVAPSKEGGKMCIISCKVIRTPNLDSYRITKSMYGSKCCTEAELKNSAGIFQLIPPITRL